MEGRSGWREAGGGRARLVLGFDGRCARCSGLANRIRRSVGDRLEVGDLRSARARRWRTHALGEDAPLVPTLFEVRGRRVRAWVGIEMGLVLARRLGAADGLKVLRALGDATDLKVGDPDPAPGPLRLVRGSLEAARGAALAGGALRTGGGEARACSWSKRVEARRIVRESEAYGGLVEELRATPDLRRAEFVAAGDGEAVGVVAGGCREGLRIFAAFLVDTHRGVLDAHRYMTVADSDGELIFTEHRAGGTSETLVVGDDYVILPGGAWVTPEEFGGLASTRGQPPQEAETDAVYGEASRSRCLQGSYAFCRRLAEAYGRSWAGASGLDAMGAAACDHLAGRAGTEAGCRAWARTRCYFGAGGGWPGG